MRLFPNDGDINRSSVAVLINLMSLESQSLRAKIGRRFVSELSGIDLVLKAMATHEQDDIIQWHCCLFLTKLAKAPNLRKDMIKAGVMSAVSRAMERHLGKERVKAEADRFMKQMYA